MAVDLDSLRAELATVVKAVNAAYSGAEFEISSGSSRRRLRRQDLSVLLARKSELEMSIARLTGEGSRGASLGIVVDTSAPTNCIGS